ncbi:L,D-transpeptidase family protein [Streptomyces sp. NPDC048057]|uniref:L,D-transpeptidase family protein n=1 Tax=Streptomyces sp. NPDC048057 TaxID=3155628 RepID=UPI0033FCD0ED
MHAISVRRVRRSLPRAALALVLAALGAALGPGAAPAAAAGHAEECSTEAGPYQKTVERHLKLTVDGVQSAADCAAIRTLQTRHGMEPATGRAGPETWRIVQYERAVADPSALTGCPHGTRLIVCVDLHRQLLWVWDGDHVATGPVPIRTGKSGYATRTGEHRIYERVEKQWSELYEGPMPFSQFFDGGQALHASYRNIWEEPGSHGCVNLRYDDAKRLWQGLRLNDPVYVWGTRGP